MRGRFSGVLANLLVVSAALASTELCARADDGRTAIFVPGTVFDEKGQGLARALGLPPWAPQKIRAGWDRSRLALPESADSTDLALLSPEGDLVALSVGEHGMRATGESPPPLALIVRDPSGSELYRLHRCFAFAWSPEGHHIAGMIGQRRWGKLSIGESVAVWSAITHAEVRYVVDGEQVAWLDSTTVLLGVGSAVDQLDTRTGSRRHTTFHGVDVSPTRRYSLDISPEGGVRVWDEKVGGEITRQIFGIRPQTSCSDYPAPAWIASHDGRDLLCIMSCRDGPESQGQTRHSVLVVDVESRSVVRTITGRGITLTTGRDHVLIASGGSLRVLSFGTR